MRPSRWWVPISPQALKPQSDRSTVHIRYMKFSVYMKGTLGNMHVIYICVYPAYAHTVCIIYVYSSMNECFSWQGYSHSEFWRFLGMVSFKEKSTRNRMRWMSADSQGGRQTMMFSATFPQEKWLKGRGRNRRDLTFVTRTAYVGMILWLRMSICVFSFSLSYILLFRLHWMYITVGINISVDEKQHPPVNLGG